MPVHNQTARKKLKEKKFKENKLYSKLPTQLYSTDAMRIGDFGTSTVVCNIKFSKATQTIWAALINRYLRKR